EKARREGPAAWVFPADDTRPGEQAQLLNLLRAQGVEVHRLNAEAKVMAYEPAGTSATTASAQSGAAEGRATDARGSENPANAAGEGAAAARPQAGAGGGPGAQRRGAGAGGAQAAGPAGPQQREYTFGAGSYVVRMDQPYSRMADMMLDTQFYNARDPRSYDDTGWTIGALRNVKTVRVLDAKILDAGMAKV